MLGPAALPVLAGANSLQAVYLVSFTMAIIAVRLLVVNNFMPVLVAGTGVMTIGVAIRCATQAEPIFFALAGLIIIVLRCSSFLSPANWATRRATW